MCLGAGGKFSTFERGIGDWAPNKPGAAARKVTGPLVANDHYKVVFSLAGADPK
jgi:hypothetical protein